MPARQRKLLLIDDDPAITCYLQHVLAHRYEVVVLHESTLAVCTVRRERPDLVVCDIEMPVLDGYGVSRALAECPDTADVALLFFTSAFSAAELHARGNAIAGRPGLSKTAPMDEILCRVDAEVEAALRPLAVPHLMFAS